jgi:hypothetical protein
MTGGTNLPGNNDAATTEEYDGTSWAVLDVAWAHTHDFVSGDLDLPRSDYRETGAGYPGSGTFNGTGFCVMNNSNFAITGLVPAYTEEFSRTGMLCGTWRNNNEWVPNEGGVAIWNFPGTIKGYLASGNTDGGGIGEGPRVIDRFSFTTDVDSTDVGDVTLGRINICCKTKSINYSRSFSNATTICITRSKIPFYSSWEIPYCYPTFIWYPLIIISPSPTKHSCS